MTHTAASLSSNSDHLPLPVRRLGLTDMHITPVGFGAWAIGGPDWAVGWGKQDDAASIAAIRHAVARGINWIDTAAVYGLGHSEELVRQALAGMPAGERPYVFTKGGLTWDEADRGAMPTRVGAPASLRREVENSLRRLNVERIDLYQMHWPAQDGTPLEEYWRTLVDLKAEGKVRAIGLSNHDAVQLEIAERIGHVDTLQPRFSAIHREAASAEFPWCYKNKTGVIVYSPMGSGLLAGSFTAQRAASLPADDWRSRSPDFTGQGLLKNLRIADAMRPIAARRGVSVASVAIAWTLAWPAVTGAIVGARSAAQVDGWLDAATLELDAEDFRDIAIAMGMEGTSAGSGGVQ